MAVITEKVIVTERVVPMEKVECVSCVNDGSMHMPGEEIEVPVRDVNKLVLSGAVKRMDQGKATDDEKAHVLRARVVEAEAKAVVAEKAASSSMLTAVENQQAQKQAQALISDAFRLRNEAIALGTELVKAEAARTEAARVKAERAAGPRPVTTPATAPHTTTTPHVAGSV